jgi:ABC-type multidrug transport system fused ATPase/permease subunit
VIPQGGVLFNDTVEFNLKYGNPNATQEQIEQVAKRCHLHEKIISMPDGYHSQVGDLGSKLSGGERQRILIARGLLKKDAQIYLFDEATSNLDAKTEKEITEWLDDVMKGKTVIYCAHRLSSIINVDKIHVVNNGRLVEQGTHAELLSNPDSTYSQMWRNYLREKQQKSLPVPELEVESK